MEAMDENSKGNFSLRQNEAAAFMNCSDEGFSFQKFYIPVIYSFLFLVCFPGNIVVIFVYIFKMRPWKTSTIIMLNLAVTDLLYVSCLPFLIHASVNGDHWVFGGFMCTGIRFTFYFNMYSSILFLTCFSLFRFFVIVYPMRCFSVQRRRWAVTASATVWAISLVMASPMIHFITVKERGNRSICLDLTNSEDLDSMRLFNWLLTTFAFFLPLVLVTVSYAMIIYKLARGPPTHTSFKQKARKLAFILLGAFYLCFLPFHILRGVRIELKVHPVSCRVEEQIRDVFTVTKSFASLNTVGNLIFYVVLGDNFQHAILSICKMNIKVTKK